MRQTQHAVAESRLESCMEPCLSPSAWHSAFDPKLEAEIPAIKVDSAVDAKNPAWGWYTIGP